MIEKRYQTLLLVALSLAAIRFLLVPWLDQQDAQHDRVQVLTQRLDRAQGVIENRAQIEAAVTAIESTSGDARKRYPSFDQPEAFRLATQQQLGALAKEFSLSIRSFEWLLDGDAAAGIMAFSRARFQVEGSLRAISGWQSTTEGRLTHMSVREFSFSSRNPVKEVESGVGTLTIVADFYWRPSISQANSRVRAESAAGAGAGGTP